MFRGAGWNVIKVIWGSRLGSAAGARQEGLLRQRWRSASTASTRTTRPRTAPTCASTSSASTRSCSRWSRDMSDDEIWRLNRGGHDPHKIYAAYHAATDHNGQPTVILAKTVKGYGMGESGEGQNSPTSRRRSTPRRCAIPRPLQHPDPRRRARRGAVLPAGRGQPGDEYLHERRKALGGYLPQRRRKPRPLQVPPLKRFRRPSWRAPASARSPPPWPSCASSARWCATRRRQAHRAHRPRRGAHLRHGRHVPPARHLLPGRPALRAGGRRPADVLPRGQDRADPGGGHQRGRRDVAPGSPPPPLHQPRPGDDPVLHLLFDVRLPAHRRPGLGGRRHARARLPAGRHGRPHHA